MILIPLFALCLGAALACYHGYLLREERKRVAERRRSVLWTNHKLPKNSWHEPPATVSYDFESKLSMGIGIVAILISVATNAFVVMDAFVREIIAGVFSATGFYGLIRFCWYESLQKFEENEEQFLFPQLPEPVAEPTPTPAPTSAPPRPIKKHEHVLVLGGAGAGKTTLLKHLIAEDLTKPCSLVVFDSQGDLIDSIIRRDFPRERVVLIDPKDVAHPVALSLFDFKTGGDTAYAREKNFNSVVELLLFVLSSLESDVSSKQRLPLEMVIRACLVIPDATIHTLLDLLSREKYQNYKHFFSELPQVTQDFFKDEYPLKQFDETREQIRRRIYTILNVSALERMFSQPKSKVNMREILDSGSAVLINTAKDFLKDEGSVFFTRFMTAMIFQAIQERDPNQNNMPTFMYIDEAGPVMSDKTTKGLVELRKYKFSMILAFQSLGQIPTSVEHAVISNTATKLVCRISAKDARALADDMGTRPDELLMTGTFHFAHSEDQQFLWYREFKLGVLEAMPKRNDLQELLAENRKKYSGEIVHRKPQQDDSTD